MSDADVKMPPLPEPAYWYVVDKHGAATLCADERDARKVAAAPIPSGKVVRVRFRGASTSGDIIPVETVALGVEGDGNGQA